MFDNEVVTSKERIKQLKQEIKELKDQFKQNKKEKLENFKIERKITIQKIRKNQGIVPKEVQEEFKQKERDLKEEIKEMEREMEQQIAEIKQKIKKLKATQKEEKLLKKTNRKQKKVTTNETVLANQKLKEIIGDKIIRNHGFYKKMIKNGILNTPKGWHKINSQVRKEIKEGNLKADDVEKRVDELIKEIAHPHIQHAKENIIKKGKLAIEIPYQSSGVNNALIGGAFFGSWGSVLGAMTEGKIKWNRTKLLILEDGINVKATGQVILYENIKKVILGDNGMLTIITTNENLVYRTDLLNAKASQELLEEYVSEYQTEPENETKTKVKSRNEKVVDDADTLIKYAELYEKGLLTKEEFEFKKAEILGINKVNNSKSENSENTLDVESTKVTKLNSVKTCPNCGNKIEINSRFCSNCGFNLEE